MSARATHAFALALGLLLALAIACGGRTVDGNGGSGGSASGGSGAPAAQADAATGNPDDFPSHDLGPCLPGFDRSEASPSRPCTWLVLPSTCYDTKDAACNCACPRSGRSVCSSAPPSSGSATPVFCYSL